MKKLLILVTALASGVTAWAASDILTEGVDPGRTGWVRSESVFTTANVGSMELLWKVKLDSTPREMHNLFPPLVISDVATASGPREMVVVSGISDDLFALDAASGELLWHKKFDTTYEPTGTGQSGTLCPGGQTATPVVGPGASPGSYTIYAVAWDGRLRQVNAADGMDLVPPENFMPPNAKPWSLNLVDGVIYTGISQGCGGVTFSFFSYDLATRRSSAFLPGGGGLWGRRGPGIAEDGTVWMGTGDGYYNPDSLNFGNGFVAVKQDDNQELKLAGWFAPPNVNWLWRRDLDINVSPILLQHRGRRLLIGTSKECRVWLVDRDVVTTTEPGRQHQQVLDTSPLICNPGARYDAAGVWGAMAAWEDGEDLYVAVPFLGGLTDTYESPIMNGTPERGGVTVLRVNANFKFEPVWTYGDIDQGDEAIYANGVLFVNGAGEDTYQRPEERAWNESPRATVGGRGSGTRIANSRHATIYALNARTGDLLWSSGEQIESWNHGSGMTAANGKAYIGTFDGYLYCFGIRR